MAPHSSTLAWKIPWMEEPGGLQSMGSLRVGHDWAASLSLFTFMHWRRKWQPTPVFLPGESQGRGSLVGCRLWGRRVEHDWSDLAAVAAAEDSCRPSVISPKHGTWRRAEYNTYAALRAKSLQSCPTICSPVDCSPPGCSVHGILQAGILEWVAVPSSRGSSPPRNWTQVSYVSCMGRRVLGSPTIGMCSGN